MAFGLKVFDASGNTTFDSTLAVGGVCLGFYTVASGGSTWSFPDFVTETAIAIAAGSGLTGPITEYMTVDHVPGYLRVSFDAVCAGITVVLFAK